MSASLSRALCLLHKARATLGTNKLLPRILLLHGSPDAASQYIAIMNCIFSAQVGGLSSLAFEWLGTPAIACNLYRRLM